MDHNVSNLRGSDQPIATIKAIQTGQNASKVSPDDAAGLDPIICIAQGNAHCKPLGGCWTCQRCHGTVKSICYHNGGAPPDLLIAVTVHFHSYTGPTLPDATVPITPICRT